MFSSVSTTLHLTCIRLTYYTSSVSCSSWFYLRKGAILSTLADKLELTVTKSKVKFCMDDFCEIYSCRGILIQTIYNSVKHVSFRWFPFALFCSFLALVSAVSLRSFRFVVSAFTCLK